MLTPTPETVLCPACGAPAHEVICQYCGALTVRLVDLESEKRALDRFHHLLSEQQPEQQAIFIRHGFYPEHLPVLVEAGLRCAALINYDNPTLDPTRSAVARLRSIIMKMKLLPPTAEGQRAITQFEAVLRNQQKSEWVALSQGIVLVLVVLGLIVLCLGGGVVLVRWLWS